MKNLIEYSPKLWQLVGEKIKKTSALYRWLNSDQGQVVGENGVYWIEFFSVYHGVMTEKAAKELKAIMKQEFGAEYLYDKVGRK